MEQAFNAPQDDPLLLVRIYANDVDDLSSLEGRRRYLTKAAA